MEGSSLKEKLAAAQEKSIQETMSKAAESSARRTAEREAKRVERAEKMAKMKEAIVAKVQKAKESVQEINRKGRETLLEAVGTVKAAPEMGKIIATEVGTTVSREATRAAEATERTVTSLYNEGVAAKNRAVEATTKKVIDVKEKYDASSDALNARLEERRRADILAWREKQAEARQATEATMGRVNAALNEAVVAGPDRRDAEARREWVRIQKESQFMAEWRGMAARAGIRAIGSGFMSELSRLVVSGGEGLKAAIDKGIEWGRQRDEDAKKIDEGTEKIGKAFWEKAKQDYKFVH